MVLSIMSLVILYLFGKIRRYAKNNFQIWHDDNTPLHIVSIVTEFKIIDQPPYPSNETVCIVWIVISHLCTHSYSHYMGSWIKWYRHIVIILKCPILSIILALEYIVMPNFRLRLLVTIAYFLCSIKTKNYPIFCSIVIIGRKLTLISF